MMRASLPAVRRFIARRFLRVCLNLGPHSRRSLLLNIVKYGRPLRSVFHGAADHQGRDALEDVPLAGAEEGGGAEEEGGPRPEVREPRGPRRRGPRGSRTSGRGPPSSSAPPPSSAPARGTSSRASRP